MLSKNMNVKFMDYNTVSNNINLVSKYWKKKILNREEVLEGHQEQNRLSFVAINANELYYFNSLTNKNPIAKYTVISAIFSFLLKKLINDFDGYVVSDYKDQCNSLLLSFPVDLNTSFKEYLQKVKYEILETLKHSDYNNDLISKKADVYDLSILSSYSININSDSSLDCKGVMFDITINENEDIEIQASYLEGFVKRGIVDYLVQHFSQFIVNLENNIVFNLSEYPLLSDNEKYQLLVNFNDKDVDYPKDKTIVNLFEEQVARTPNNIAVIFKESKSTYKELNEKANQLANYISSKHTISSGDIIGVFLPKSDIGIISLLAIIKLGAVHLPIDTNYPQERIDYLIKDSGLKLLINDDAKLEIDICDTIVINTINFKDNSSNNINTAISSKDLAYVIYTSGSTGQPKGVMVEHTSNVNMSLDQIRSFEITESDKVVWFASVAFDASISEIMMSLYSGATLCIPTEDIIKDKEQFVSFLKETNSSVVTFPPSYLGLLSEDDISGLRCVITAGESANPSKAIAVVESGIDYYNAYGPTECAVCVSIYKTSKNDFDKSLIPIGKPISNTKIYILDEALQPLPIGVAGKIYVSGAGVARGYLNKPKLTSEKFVANPFQEGERMYDTGDIGCWLADGNIEFLGRKDQQVKIRGYRIELGEIENTILQYSEDLKQVVVEVKENNLEEVLVAYLVSTVNIDKSKLRSFLQNRLPDFMVPGFYVALEKLPLTPNGKIDRKALPDISEDDIIRREYVAPRNEVEKSLVAIWQEVLGVDKIGITDNFFELGGHSLMVSQIINRTHKQLGQTVSFKVFFTSPTIKDLSGQLQINQYTLISKAPESESYPLSASQSRLWILSQLEGGSLAYNMPATVKLNGIVDVNKFEESFTSLIHRHEILRTYFKTNEEGEVRQNIVPASQITFKIEEKDFSLVENQEEEIADYLQERNSIPFDLEQAQLVRASLIKTKEEEYVFFLSLHHIIGDGWSLQILMSEIVKNYQALIERHKISLQELSFQYKDYAVWLQEEVQLERNKKSEQYWLKQFEGEIPILNIPNFRSRPLLQTYKGNFITHTFSIEFFERLKDFSNKKDATLFMVLMAGINALMYRYTGQCDIIIGTPIAGREHPEIENQLGLFVNTLPIRTNVNGTLTFSDLLKNEKETLLEAYEHQNYPFDLLVEKLNLKRDNSRSVLFDVLVVLQNQGSLINLKTDELTNFEVTPYHFNAKTSKFDINFNFVDGELLELTIEYNTDIYDFYLIDRMFSHLENFLEKAIIDSNQPIAQIKYLTEEEEIELLLEFNDTETDYSSFGNIVSLFENQVNKTPDSTAIIFKKHELTYRDLNEKANQLARYIKLNYDIQADDLIGLKMEKSELTIIAILGILKCGAAYVPIDPNYPTERIAYIEKDSNCKVVIDDSFLKKFEEFQHFFSILNLDVDIKDSNLVYIIYTSGSTGIPKGIMMEHKSMLNLIVFHNNQFFSENIRKVLQFTSISFDVSFQEIFSTLTSGAILYPISETIKTDSKALSVFIRDNDIDTVFLPTSYFKLLMDVEDFTLLLKFNIIKNIIVAGEQLTLSNDAINKFKDSKVKLHNHYGPAETHVVSTLIVTDGYLTSNPPIGFPISNTSIYILDDNLKAVPVGVIGKLFISGAGVARGYLNKKELTCEKFILNPFKAEDKIYNTGDLASWLPDGNIIFLGRNDHQVKIRGYRIELGEIENVISQYSEDLNQVIVETKYLNEEKVLAAYFISKNEIVKSELQSFLKSKLPDYMVPSLYVNLDMMPFTPNGKIDRKALPDISINDFVTAEYQKPENEIEKSIIDIWEDVLGINNFGVTDNFFELGGHSLKIVKVINRINIELKKTISYNSFFYNPTVRQIASLIENHNHEDIFKALESESYPITPMQQAIWAHEQIEPDKNLYNFVAATEILGDLDLIILKKVFKELIKENEVFRTNFHQDENGTIKQFVSNLIDDFDIQIYDFENSLDEIVSKEYLTSFDLSRDFLFRISILKCDSKKHVLILTIHHLINDGWSILLIKKKIVELYFSLKNDTPSERNLNNRFQFKDYAVWLIKELEKDNIKKQKLFWLEKFKNQNYSINLPILKDNREIYEGGNIFDFCFSKEFKNSLDTFSISNKSTLFTTLLCGVKALLYRYTNEETIVIATPTANRNRNEFEDVIGCFLNTILIKSDFSTETTLKELIADVNQSFVEAQENSFYPIESWSRELVNGQQPFFNVMVVLHNHTDLFSFSDNEIHFNDLKIKGKTASQYDLIFRFIEKDSLELEVEYNPDLFDKKNIERLIYHFRNLLISSINNPYSSLINFSIITNEEELEFKEFNNTECEYPMDKNFVDLFNERVVKTPNKLAIKDDNNNLTYLEVDELSNKFSNFLLNRAEIKPEDLIGVNLEKSALTIVVLLGIIKTGAAYIPIDLNYPVERQEYLLKLSDCKLVLDKSTIEDFLSCQDSYSSNAYDVSIAPEQLFHVMFTSGSTGQPKGVMISHRNLVNFITTNDYFPLDETTVLLSTVSISFDTTNMEFWGVLFNGGTIILSDNDNLFDYQRLKNIILANNVNSLWFTASWFSQIVDSDIEVFKGLRQFISGGDILSAKHINLLKKKYPDLKLFNGYGPTENTTFSTVYEIKDNISGNISIGKPIKNTQVHILNDLKIKQPIGIAGKIFLSGDNLSKGYFNNTVLTEEKFISNAVALEVVMYDTGDIGKWLPDGNIEYLGRKDSQVKIRGFRIELDEIERKVYDYSPFIKQACVDLKLDNNEKKLVLYIVGENTIEEQKLSIFLSMALPNYMVPTYILQLDELPLTPNGKIDRKALSKNNVQKKLSCGYVESKSDLQKQLVAIWEEVLGINKIGIEDNFFELGGNSLSIINIINKIKKELNSGVSFKEFYENSTICKLSDFISKSNKEIFSIANSPKKSYYNLSYAQKRIWLLSQSAQVSLSYNSPFILAIDATVEDIIDSLKLLFEKYEIFRTQFLTVENYPKQQIISQEDLNFDSIINVIESKELFDELINKDLLSTFDLRQAPLIRVKLLKDQEKTICFFNIHHILIDGWSYTILINELNELIEGKKVNGKFPDIKKLKIQYKDFSEWQIQFLKSEKAVKQKNFWIQKYKGFDQIPLQTDFERTYKRSNEGKTLDFKIERKLLEKISDYILESNSTFFIFYTTVVSWILCHQQNRDSIVIGTLDANRDHPDLINQIGFFANTLALKFDIHQDFSFDDFYNVCKSEIIDYFDHKECPFDLVVEELKPIKNGSQNPFFDIMVIVQNPNTVFKENKITGNYFSKNQSKADIIFEFIGDDICKVLYDSILFKQETIQTIIDQVNYFLIEKFDNNNYEVNINKIRKQIEMEKISVDEIQNTVYEKFKNLLPNKIIGVNDNFFELGGSSLDLMGLVIELSEEFKVNIDISEIIEDLTILKVSEVVCEKLI